MGKNIKKNIYIYIYKKQNHFAVYQKLKHYKSIILQFRRKDRGKKGLLKNGTLEIWNYTSEQRHYNLLCIIHKLVSLGKLDFRNEKQLGFKFVSRRDKTILKKNQMESLGEEKEDLQSIRLLVLLRIMLIQEIL